MNTTHQPSNVVSAQIDRSIDLISNNPLPTKNGLKL